jgi:hypothetical protein
MALLVDVLRVVHVITALLMAWPFYALLAVNQRARLGPPLDDRADAHLENIIKYRTVPYRASSSRARFWSPGSPWCCCAVWD